MKTTLIFAVVCGLFGICTGPAAGDIIGPSAVNKPLQVPEALVGELPPDRLDLLHPLMPLFATGDLAGFKTEYAKVKDSVNTLPAVEVLWSKLLVTQNRLADALRQLEEYIKEHPEDPEAYITFGVIGIKSGRLTDAWLQLLYAQRLLDRNSLNTERQQLIMPNFVEARAVVAEGRRQWAEAEQQYKLLQDLKPEDQFVKWRAGRALVLAGKIDAGVQLMQAAAQIDSKLPRATLAVAQALADGTEWKKQSDTKSTIETWFKKALTENAADSNAWVAYFKWLLLNDRPTEVIEQAEQLAEPLQATREIVLMQALAQRYVGDIAAAENLLTPLHQAQPDDLEVADQLALVLIESSDEAKRGRALQLADRNLRSAPEVEAIVGTAAWVQFRLGSDDIANRLLSQLSSRGPLSPLSTYYVAQLLQKHGQTAESKRLLKAAAETVGLFPQRSNVEEQLANDQ